MIWIRDKRIRLIFKPWICFYGFILVQRFILLCTVGVEVPCPKAAITMDFWLGFYQLMYFCRFLSCLWFTSILQLLPSAPPPSATATTTTVDFSTLTQLQQNIKHEAGWSGRGRASPLKKKKPSQIICHSFSSCVNKTSTVHLQPPIKSWIRGTGRVKEKIFW